MEPIDPFLGAHLHPDAKEKRKIGKRGTDRVRFSSVMDSSEPESGTAGTGQHGLADPDATLEALLDGVHEAGDRVKETASLAVLHEYKEAVREFLSYVIRHTLAVEQKESAPNVRKRKRFTLIKVIDQKLDRLAAGIVQNQHDQLEILRRIDEISGLLVDILS